MLCAISTPNDLEWRPCVVQNDRKITCTKRYNLVDVCTYIVDVSMGRHYTCRIRGTYTAVLELYKYSNFKHYCCT